MRLAKRASTTICGAYTSAEAGVGVEGAGVEGAIVGGLVSDGAGVGGSANVLPAAATLSVANFGCTDFGFGAGVFFGAGVGVGVCCGVGVGFGVSVGSGVGVAPINLSVGFVG